jgi:hypothetical protein
LKNIESPAYCLFSSLISHNAKGKQELWQCGHISIQNMTIQ